MEKHFLISESEKSRILNLHKNLLNEHGTMTEATTGVDLVTAAQAINKFFPPEAGGVMGGGGPDLSKIKVTDSSGKSIPLNGFSRKQISNGTIIFSSSRKPQAFNVKDSQGMQFRANGKVLKGIGGPSGKAKLTCGVDPITKKNGCMAKFVIPSPPGLQKSDINNRSKQLIAIVKFIGSKWDDNAKNNLGLKKTGKLAQLAKKV
tara:strand:+ start:1623 stop:2234 length:612 start_codon:yes stop_codon:yes gene_type:complete